MYIYIFEVLFEVAIESWPEWDLNPRPLNSVQTLLPTELSDHEFNIQLALRANFAQLLQFHHFFSVQFHFSYCLRQSPRLF